jgi:hypothetical protein
MEKEKPKFHHCPSIGSMLPEGEQDFKHRITIDFEDGSKVVFEYACTKSKPEHLDVYTEHCGYHSFRLASIATVKYEPYGGRHAFFGPNWKKTKLPKGIKEE